MTVITVIRAGRLQGVARWSVVALAAAYVLSRGLLLAPFASFTIAVLNGLAEARIDLIMPLLMVLVGISIALHRRSAQIRQRLRVIKENW